MLIELNLNLKWNQTAGHAGTAVQGANCSESTGAMVCAETRHGSITRLCAGSVSVADGGEHGVDLCLGEDGEAKTRE